MFTSRSIRQQAGVDQDQDALLAFPMAEFWHRS